VRERFKVALTRESKLRELWLTTEKQNKDYLMLTINLSSQKENLERQLALREQEKAAMTKVYKKGKRKSFLKGAGWGLGLGVIGSLFLISQI